VNSDQAPERSFKKEERAQDARAAVAEFKVGVPFQPELAMGAVADGGGSIIVRNEDVIEHVGIGEPEFKTVCDAKFAEIERRRERYLGNRERAKVTGRTAIVIDDGIATGRDDPRGSARYSHAQSEAARARGAYSAERQPYRTAAGGRRHSVS
jgi:predicted phosphoribosyltransferase